MKSEHEVCVCCGYYNVTDFCTKCGFDNAVAKLIAPKQLNWKILCHKFGGEDEAKKEVSRQLRMFADIIDAPGYPRIFGCQLLPVESTKITDVMGTIEVTLSHPWGG